MARRDGARQWLMTGEKVPNIYTLGPENLGREQLEPPPYPWLSGGVRYGKEIGLKF